METEKGRDEGRVRPLSMLRLLTAVQGCWESCPPRSQIHGRCLEVFQGLGKQEGSWVRVPQEEMALHTGRALPSQTDRKFPTGGSVAVLPMAGAGPRLAGSWIHFSRWE